MKDVIKKKHYSPTAGFKITKKDKQTKARLGILTTPHGVVKTPSYVFVGTYGKFRHLTDKDIKRTGAQLVIANTFHLWDPALARKSGAGKAGDTFLTRSFGLKIPTMTDSGGFQVLSLAFGDKSKVGKFMTGLPRPSGRGELKPDASYERSKIRITQKGVHFKYNNKKLFLGPELSMKLQKKIGADIIFAFDHITSPLDDYDYNEKAVALTNKWAKICLKTRDPKQQLFGIVQGGLFKNLRIKSAKSIGTMPFDGFGIGGSYTKKQIAKILKWIIPHLPEEKPRHLLGVGKVEDIFEAIENGIDTFDCVIPTREARHGRLYTRTGHLDIRRGKFSADNLPAGEAGKVIEKGCGCLTCMSGVSRQQIRESLKGQPSNTTSTSASRNSRRQVDVDILGQRWCLMHNMWFFNKLLEDIRDSIAKGRFLKFKEKTLSRFN